jgi:DNA-binding NarL/FixJ family response regulator
MNRLVFIDDDKRELDEFGRLIEGEYTCTLIHWPNDREKLFSGESPNLFLSDLYLPSADGDHKPDTEQIEEAATTAREIAHRFHSLYAGGTQAVESIELCKARLRDTMTLITYAAEELLRRQWEALGQSPANGIALLEQVAKQFPEVPFVFYSRKINAEDAIKVLKAGAVDAIRKDVDPEELLARLRDAHRFRGRRRFLQS